MGYICWAFCFVFICVLLFFVGGFFLKFWVLSGRSSLDDGGIQFMWDHATELITVDPLFIEMGFTAIAIFIVACLIIKGIMWIVWRQTCAENEDDVYYRLKRKREKRFAMTDL